MVVNAKCCVVDMLCVVLCCVPPVWYVVEWDVVVCCEAFVSNIVCRQSTVEGQLQLGRSELSRGRKKERCAECVFRK